MGLQRVQIALGNWFASAGSNRSGSGDNGAVEFNLLGISPVAETRLGSLGFCSDNVNPNAREEVAAEIGRIVWTGGSFVSDAFPMLLFLGS